MWDGGMKGVVDWRKNPRGSSLSLHPPPSHLCLSFSLLSWSGFSYACVFLPDWSKAKHSNSPVGLRSSNPLTVLLPNGQHNDLWLFWALTIRMKPLSTIDVGVHLFNCKVFLHVLRGCLFCYLKGLVRFGAVWVPAGICFSRSPFGLIASSFDVISQRCWVGCAGE